MNADDNLYSVYFYEDDPPSVQHNVGIKDIRVPRSASALSKPRKDYVTQTFNDKSGNWEVMSVDHSKNTFKCKCIHGKSKGDEKQYGVGEAILLIRQTEKKSNKKK